MPIDTDAEERDVVLLDTSTAVAFVDEDHEAHAAIFAALEGRRPYCFRLQTTSGWSHPC